MDTVENLMESLIKQIARKMLDCLPPPAVEPPPHRLALDAPEILPPSNSDCSRPMQGMHNLPNSTHYACTCNLCPYKFQKELSQTNTNANLNMGILQGSEAMSQLNHGHDYLSHLNATDAMESVGNELGQNINKCLLPVHEEIITNIPDVLPSSSSALNVTLETKTQKGTDEPLYNCQLQMNENKNIMKINVQCVSNPDRRNTEVANENNSKVGKIFLRKLKEMTEVYNLPDPRTVEEYPQQSSHVGEKHVVPKQSLSCVSVQGTKKRRNRNKNKAEQRRRQKLRKAAEKYFQESMTGQCYNDVLQKDRQNEIVGKIFLNKRREMTEIYNLPSDRTIEDYPPEDSTRVIAPITSAGGKKQRKKRKKGKKDIIIAVPNQPTKNKKKKKKKVNQITETQSVQEEYMVTKMFTQNVGNVVPERMAEYCMDTYYSIDS